MEWSVQTTESISVPVFADSVEQGSYAQGTCGEKEVQLVAPPSFISLTKGSDPLTDPFTITYDDSTATEADIGTHTITYTVKIKEYAAITTQITGTFSFEIQCPTIAALTENSWTASSTTFSLMQNRSKTVAFPSISFSPTSCFSLTW